MNYYTGELYHHGILGQKWGVRRFQNPDGTLTPAGKERYSSSSEQKKFGELSSKGTGQAVSSAKRQLASDRIRRSPQVQHAASVLKDKAKISKGADDEYDKLVDDFYNDRKLYEKYLNKAVDLAYQKSVEFNGSEVWSRDEIYDAYRYDDSDQGDYSSIELFKRSGDKRGKALAEAEKKQWETYEDLQDSAMEYAKDFLGEYGDKIIARNEYYQSTVASRVKDIIADEAKRKNYSFADKAVNLRKAF